MKYIDEKFNIKIINLRKLNLLLDKGHQSDTCEKRLFYLINVRLKYCKNSQ